jgi:hypothetical protein
MKDSVVIGSSGCSAGRAFRFRFGIQARDTTTRRRFDEKLVAVDVVVAHKNQMTFLSERCGTISAWRVKALRESLGSLIAVVACMCYRGRVCAFDSAEEPHGF